MTASFWSVNGSAFYSLADLAGLLVFQDPLLRTIVRHFFFHQVVIIIV